MQGADPQRPEPPDPTENQSYPREELVAMVNRAQRVARLRGNFQIWALGLGLALLALGLSSERQWGSMELPRMVAGEGGGLSYGLIFPIAAGLPDLRLGSWALPSRPGLPPSGHWLSARSRAVGGPDYATEWPSLAGRYATG
jgi:hypothetical protein